MRRRLWVVIWPQVANDETDLLKVGFLFLEEVMVVELKVVR
jgi:hypothetical protein